MNASGRLLAVVSLLLSAPVLAGAPITVWVVPLDAWSAAQQGTVEGVALESLQRAARFEVRTPSEAWSPELTRARTKRIAEADALVKTGRKALDELDNVRATEAFSQAWELLRTADSGQHFPALLDAWVNKAAGHATGGETAAARRELEALLSVAPKTELSVTLFPPELLKFAETLRKQIANAKGELLVRTEPSGARVWVDGVFRGVSPVTVAGLSATKHTVTATLGGGFAQTETSPGETRLDFPTPELNDALTKAIGTVKGDPEGAGRDQAGQTLARAAQLEQLVLVVAKKSLTGDRLELTGIRLEARDGHNDAFAQASIAPTPEALGTFFDGLVGRDARRDGRDAVHHYRGSQGSPVRTTVGVTLVAVGAAALATGATFGVLALEAQNAFRQTPQTKRVESEALTRDGKTYALVADLSLGLGLLSAGTGGVLLLTQGASSAPPPLTPEEEAKQRDADRRAAEERRAADERRRADEQRRSEERERETQRNKENKEREAKEAEDRKRAEEAQRQADEEAAKSKPLTKKEQAALEKKQREEDAQRKKDEAKRQKEEDDKKKAEEAQRKKDEAAKAKADEAQKKKDADDEAKRKKDEAAKAKADDAQKKKDADDEAKRKRDEEAKAKADEDQKKKDDAAKAKAEEAQKKKDADDEAKRKRDEEAKAKADEAQKKKDDEAQAKREREEAAKKDRPLTKKEKAALERQEKEDEAKRLKEEEEKKKEEEAKRLEAERQRRAEEEKRRQEEKKKREQQDHDDLRNY